ncbi:MAG: MFS transporter [Rhodospirillales bacterium]|nr:MFS transporter [Rhodospirillales bacterium]MBO6787571.1 MFS transporter [Rhodospirillales bacterium]
MRLRFVHALADRLPFYYGWIILAAVCAASFSRQGPAVATLSIFIEPMTSEFGWSRTEISGAVSLGGVLGAVAAPLIGPFLDRNGARTILCFAVLTTGIPLLCLSAVNALPVFYAFYCVARMNFTGPYDIGIYGSIVNWFHRKRSFATSITTLALMSGLVAMPLIAHVAMQAGGWRSAWIAVGTTVLVVGFIPAWLFLVRRPEDLGLEIDGDSITKQNPSAGETSPDTKTTAAEPVFTRAEAIRTPAFWLLSAFSLLVWPIQAGVSLHQAPLLLERGLDATVAATAVSTFSFTSAIVGFAYGFWPKRIPLRFAMVLIGVSLGAAALAMNAVETAPMAYGAAVLFGFGIGGLLTTVPIAWADFFGRRSYGAIRGVALTIQVASQAAGPLIAGALRDVTGTYDAALLTFAVFGFAAAFIALLAKPPRATGP